jgi:hypothetical protein
MIPRVVAFAAELFTVDSTPTPLTIPLALNLIGVKDATVTHEAKRVDPPPAVSRGTVSHDFSILLIIGRADYR